MNADDSVYQDLTSRSSKTTATACSISRSIQTSPDSSVMSTCGAMLLARTLKSARNLGRIRGLLALRKVPCQKSCRFLASVLGSIAQSNATDYKKQIRAHGFFLGILFVFPTLFNRLSLVGHRGKGKFPAWISAAAWTACW